MRVDEIAARGVLVVRMKHLLLALCLPLSACAADDVDPIPTPTPRLPCASDHQVGDDPSPSWRWIYGYDDDGNRVLQVLESPVGNVAATVRYTYENGLAVREVGEQFTLQTWEVETEYDGRLPAQAIRTENSGEGYVQTWRWDGDDLEGWDRDNFRVEEEVPTIRVRYAWSDDGMTEETCAGGDCETVEYVGARAEHLGDLTDWRERRGPADVTVRTFTYDDDEVTLLRLESVTTGASPGREVITYDFECASM